MNRTFSIVGILIALAVVAPAQSVITAYFPDNLTTGSSNTFPWNTGTTTGYTTVNIYPLATLMAQGVRPTMLLTGLALMPQTGSGSMTQPTARVYVGHAATTTASNLWINNLADPTVVWDTAVDGPLTVPGWAAGVWAPIPVRPGFNWTWDGTRNVVVMISQGGGYTAAYSVTTSPTAYTRHGVAQFMPTPGTAAGTTGTLAPRLRLTFACTDGFSVTSTGGDLVVTPPAIGPLISEGYTFVSTTPSATLGVGWLFGITPDFVTWEFIQTPAAYGNPLHWLAQPVYPGIYPYAPFILPPGTMTPFSGQTWEFVSFAFPVGMPSYEYTCVRRVTF